MQPILRVIHDKRAILIGSTVLVIVVGALAALLVINGTTTPTRASPQSITTLPVKATVATTEVVVKSTPSPPAKMIPVKVTAYTLEGNMADGKPTHPGACAVNTTQFPLGTIIYLYNPDGTFNRQCLAEDTGSGVGFGEIDLAMPGDEVGAANWGVRHLLARVIRRGWGSSLFQNFCNFACE